MKLQGIIFNPTLIIISIQMALKVNEYLREKERKFYLIQLMLDTSIIFFSNSLRCNYLTNINISLSINYPLIALKKNDSRF